MKPIKGRVKGDEAVKHVVDITVQGQGVYSVFPLTVAAREWVERNVSLEPWQWLGQSFVVESGYIEALTRGMVRDALTVQVNGRSVKMGTGPCKDQVVLT